MTGFQWIQEFNLKVNLGKSKVLRLNQRFLLNDKDSEIK